MFIRPILFSPPIIPGCTLWLDAADTNSMAFLTESQAVPPGTVATWTDKSGFAGSATSFFANPVYNSAGKFVQFGPGQAMRINQTFEYTTAWTAVVFVDIISLGDAGRNFLSTEIGTGAQSQGIVQMGMGFANKRKIGDLLVLEIGDRLGPDIQITRATNTNGIGTYSFQSIGTTASVVLGGNVISNRTTLGIGASPNATVAPEGTYNVYEIIMYNSALTNDHWRLLERYFSLKWDPIIIKRQLILPNLNKIMPLPYSSFFRPTSISGCRFWLDAADSDSLFDFNNSAQLGAIAGAWRDKVTSAIAYAQGNTQKSLISNELNNRRCIHFDNSESDGVYMTVTLPFFSQGSAFIAFKVKTQRVTGNFPIFSWTNDTTTGKFPAFGFLSNSTLTVGPSTTNDANGTPIRTMIDSDNTQAFYSWNSGTTAVGFDGTTPISGTQVNYSGTTNTLLIGGGGTDVVNRTNMFLGEIIIYDKVVSVSERQRVESYLANKWALENELPTNHPGLTLPAGAPSFLTAITRKMGYIENANASIGFPHPPFSLLPPPIVNVYVPPPAPGEVVTGNGMWVTFYNTAATLAEGGYPSYFSVNSSWGTSGVSQAVDSLDYYQNNNQGGDRPLLLQVVPMAFQAKGIFVIPDGGGQLMLTVDIIGRHKIFIDGLTFDTENWVSDNGTGDWIEDSSLSPGPVNYQFLSTEGGTYNITIRSANTGPDYSSQIQWSIGAAPSSDFSTFFTWDSTSKL